MAKNDETKKKLSELGVKMPKKFQDMTVEDIHKIEKSIASVRRKRGPKGPPLCSCCSAVVSSED